MAALLDLNWTEDKTTWLKSFRSLVKISVPLVESNITNIMKTCLLNISVVSIHNLFYHVQFVIL